MADMHSELNRRLSHPQPARVPLTHWSADGDYLHPGTDPAACGSCKAHEPATGVNAGTPSDRDGADDAPDEAKGVSSPAPVAVTADHEESDVSEYTAKSGLPACGSCGEPAPYTITLRGEPMSACLRHLNHWRTPPCPDCGGINGQHGLVHVRYGNGGGGNRPCPRVMCGPCRRGQHGVCDRGPFMPCGCDHLPVHPLTPADPHDHAWADLGTPGLHGSVCRLCGETQID